MTTHGQRRIHTVRLAARDRGLVRRGVILLEDALRIASVPGVHGSGMLLVRSLSLGAIRRNQSSAAIASTIEELLRQFRPIALHGMHPAAPAHPVVYFQDAAEPYRCLALRLALRQPITAWFWPLAVPRWHPAMPRDQALRQVLHASMQTEAGLMAAGSIVQELQEHEALTPLLAALQRQDGSALLQSAGWLRPSLPLALVDIARQPPLCTLGHPWPIVLSTWAGHWGRDDPRLLWLAATALVLERPARLMQSRLPEQAQQVIKYVLSRSWSAPASPAPSRAGHPLNAPATRPLPVDDASDTTNASSASAMTSEPSPCVMSPVTPARDTMGQGGPPLARAEPHPAVPGSSAGGGRHAEPAWAADVPEWLRSPLPTQYGGLFFLLQVMTRLGITAQLGDDDRLLELNFPARLLHYVGQRLGIPPHDPVRVALTSIDESSDALLDGFTSPALWWQGLARPGHWIIYRMASSKGQRVLSERPGHLQLASWQGRIPDAVRHLASGRPVHKGAVLPPQSTFDLCLHTWMQALRRWCRRYAYLGLHNLVYRPGSIAVTRTHIDMIFNHDQVDLRIRKAGLDLNPGWVPWLGKVVHYHYLYGEEVYAT